MKKAYKDMILKAVDECHDIDLLDLVWKMLVNAEGAPSPYNIHQEVKHGEYKKDMRRVPRYTDGARETVKHPAPNSARLVWRTKKPAGVRGGADLLQSAA